MRNEIEAPVDTLQLKGEEILKIEILNTHISQIAGTNSIKFLCILPFLEDSYDAKNGVLWRRVHEAMHA